MSKKKKRYLKTKNCPQCKGKKTMMREYRDCPFCGGQELYWCSECYYETTLDGEEI